VPDVGVDEFAVWPEMLLLVDGDVPGWLIGSPPSQRSGADPYGDSDCPLLDLVRGVDTYDRLETAGRGAATFYNMVFETGSAAISEGLIDAVRGAPSMCPWFTDDHGMGWLEPLDVPSAGDWDAAGLAIGAGAEPVLIGYWANDGTIVKLRVVGPAAYSEFPALTQAVAAKLGAATTGPDEFDDPYEYDEFDDPWSDDAWLTHPLSGMILDESDLGADWWRWNVIVDEGTPAGAEELCGITAPAQPGGLSAWFEKGDDAVATQLVMNTTPDEAQQWLEVFRLLAACGGFDERSMRVTYELVPTSPDQVAGADDLVVLRSMFRPTVTN
jgi:hypothetical protein